MEGATGAAVVLATVAVGAVAAAGSTMVSLESILAVFIGSLLGPLFTWLFKKFPHIDPSLGATINLYVCTGLYLLAWALLTRTDTAQLERYILWGMASAGVGNAGNNYYKKRLSWEARVGRMYRREHGEGDSGKGKGGGG